MLPVVLVSGFQGNGRHGLHLQIAQPESSFLNPFGQYNLHGG